MSAAGSGWSWGDFEDPDVDRGLAAYGESGLSVRTPEQTSRDPEATARRAVEVLRDAYRGHYPAVLANEQDLAGDVRRGDAWQFELVDGEGRAAAVVGLHRALSWPGAAVHGVTICRGAKRHHAAMPARALVKLAVLWARWHLGPAGFDHLHGTPRLAGAAGGLPGGEGIQRIWWGGRRHGSGLPLVSQGATWSTPIGPVQPIGGFVMPFAPRAWRDAIGWQRVHVSSGLAAEQLGVLFEESVGPARGPAVEVRLAARSELPPLARLRPPTPQMTTPYVLTGEPVAGAETVDLAAVPRDLGPALGQVVVVESDVVASRRAGPAATGALDARGWTMTGWRPSATTPGGIALVYSRLAPAALTSLARPRLDPAAFDGSGYRRTRFVMATMLDAMRHRSRRVLLDRPA